VGKTKQRFEKTTKQSSGEETTGDQKLFFKVQIIWRVQKEVPFNINAENFKGLNNISKESFQ